MLSTLNNHFESLPGSTGSKPNDGNYGNHRRANWRRMICAVYIMYVYLQCGLMHRYLTTRRRNQRKKAHADQISATNNTRHARNHGRKHTGEAGGRSMSRDIVPVLLRVRVTLRPSYFAKRLYAHIGGIRNPRKSTTLWVTRLWFKITAMLL